MFRVSDKLGRYEIFNFSLKGFTKVSFSESSKEFFFFCHANFNIVRIEYRNDPKFRTPENFVVSYVSKIQTKGQTLGYFVKKMQME